MTDVTSVFDPRYFNSQLQQFQHLDKYARWNHEKGRRETWDESVARAVAYLIELSENKLSNSDYTEIFNSMLNMDAFCSMRLFAMAGEAARRCNSVLYNCSYIAVDSIQSISEILYLSMSGTGVGFSVEIENVNKLPKIRNFEPIDDGSGFPPAWKVEDSQEGWAKALHLGLTSWFNGFDAVFDYSDVRPVGSVLRTKGGRSSGPEPLQRLLDYSKEVILKAQGRKLKPIEVHDIVCMIGDCAISGGSRRSAMISLFDKDDQEMLHAKDYGWWKTAPQRANANNSVVITEDLTRQEVESVMYTMHNGGGGEPGFYMRKNAGKMAPRRTFVTEPGTNPCFHRDTLILTRDGAYRIEDLVGKSVHIWNGESWVLVDNFRVTNQNQSGVEIELESGHIIIVTDYHSMLLADGTRKQAKDLQISDRLMPTVIKDPNGEYSRSNNKTRVYRITNRFLEGDVYCCTESVRHEISLACGVQIGQCGEIDLNSRQFCNLSQAIVRTNDTAETLKKKVKIATIIGTIQSMATKFKFISSEWQVNTERDRLLGTDLTGQLDNPDLITPGLLDELREYAIEVNKEYAEKLGITQSAAVTCNKPSGNSSILFSCAPGIHSQWSDYYIRRVRVNANSPMRYAVEYSGFKLQPENGQQYETATTLVAEFPMKAPDGAITNGDRGAIEQCEWWKMNKLHWTEHNPSCFSGSERFITNKGLEKFSDFSDGDEVIILDENGSWKKAAVRKFGKQTIWELEVERCRAKKTIRTTGNHLWPVSSPSGRFFGNQYDYFQETRRLNNKKTLVTINPVAKIKLDPVGVLHGIVFGDGTRRNYSVENGRKNHAQIYLCNDPMGSDSRDLSPLFEQAGYKAIDRPDVGAGQTRIYGLPVEWKSLPKTNDPEYIRGFIAGWFAADGHIDVRGGYSSICNINKSNLEWLQKYAPVGGVAVSTNIQKNTGSSTLVGESTWYTIGFMKESLDSDFFILDKKKARFNEAQFPKQWKIISVKETNDTEDVYCLEVPETNMFVLEGNILTHNCTISYVNNELDDIIDWIHDNQDIIGGMSFLEKDNHYYPLSPYDKIDKETYEAMVAKLPQIDFDLLQVLEHEDQTTVAQEIACVAGQCLI